jgi:hypothetical protein
MRRALGIVLTVSVAVVPWSGCATATAGRRTEIPLLSKGGHFPALRVALDDAAAYDLTPAEVDYDSVGGTLPDGGAVQIPFSLVRGVSEIANDETVSTPHLSTGRRFVKLDVALNDGRVYHLWMVLVSDDAVLGRQPDGTVVSIPLQVIEGAWAPERVPGSSNAFGKLLLVAIVLTGLGYLGLGMGMSGL